MTTAMHNRSIKSASKNPVTVKVAKKPKTNAINLNDIIAEAAYYKAEKRGFVPGYEVQDWLEAEREVG